MSLVINETTGNRLDPYEASAWRAIPTAIISDERNRAGTLDAGIRLFSTNGPLVGIAHTVRAMAADNLALHHAVATAFPGAVIVADAGGFDRNAVWGGILHKAAEYRQIAGVIIDGCVRDVAELRSSPVTCYARGTVPAGPHKAWGGEIGGVVQVGGTIVHPGDIVVGDEDGVAIVPFEQRGSLLQRCQARIAAEANILDQLAAGKTTVEIFGLQV